MSDFLPTKPYKGTRDFYPEDMHLQKWMFNTLRQSIETFGYEEYDGPMLESFELYAAKTGEEIVENQLYWFTDRGDRKLALRPEMTPTMARMVAARANELPKPIRWYSIPNLWRYERPQRGRLREHWQLNVDLLGGDPLLADYEIIQLTQKILKDLGGQGKAKTLINNRRLINYFFSEALTLDAPTALKASKAVDARAKIGEEKYQIWLDEIGITQNQSQKIENFFNATFEEIKSEYPCEGTQELIQLFALIENNENLSPFCQFDPKIMRGLDYYTGMIFEVYDQSPDNNRSMFGGGRYDNLVGLFGKESISGVGFGMGDVTLKNFCETYKLFPDFGRTLDVYVTLTEESHKTYMHKVADLLRNLPSQPLKVATALTASKFGQQLKTADKLKAKFVAIIGEDEIQKQCVSLKNLLTGDQTQVKLEDLEKVNFNL